MYTRTRYSPSRHTRTHQHDPVSHTTQYSNSRPVEYIDQPHRNVHNKQSVTRVYHRSPSPGNSGSKYTKTTVRTRNERTRSRSKGGASPDPKENGQDSYSPLNTKKGGQFESFAPAESSLRDGPYTQNSRVFTSSYAPGNNYPPVASSYHQVSPVKHSHQSNHYAVRQSPGLPTSTQRSSSPGGNYYTKKIDALTEDNSILKTLTHKLQNGLMECKRNNRIIQRKLDILEDQGNDPTNTYKLKKSTRDQILEERNKELREENEAHVVEIREAQTRIKELEGSLHEERINKVISPDTPEDVDDEKISKLVNEIDQMDDVERKSELKLLISHLQEQKKQIKELEEQAEEKDTEIEELKANEGETPAEAKTNTKKEGKTDQFADDYESKLVEIKTSMIDRLVNYFYNDFLDCLDESKDSDKHSALIFQLKMADRRTDLACIIHAHIQNYKE